MSKLSKEELLEWVNIRIENNKCMDCEKIFQQIKEMIQKPQVTEEWIHNYTKKWWIKHWKDLWDRDILHNVDAEKLGGTIRLNFKALQNFIRKIVEEIK